MIVEGIRGAHVVGIVGEKNESAATETTADQTLGAADETQEALIAPVPRIEDEGIAAEIADTLRKVALSATNIAAKKEGTLGRMIVIVIEGEDVEDVPAAAHVAIHVKECEVIAGDVAAAVGIADVEEAAAKMIASLIRSQRYM